MKPGARTFPIVVAIAAMSAQWQAGAQEGQLPNLTPLPPTDVRIGNPDTPQDGTRALRFTVTTANVGDHPLEVLGFPPRDAERTEAAQCVEWVGRVCARRQHAGTLTFHAAHQHWHYEEYARYELRALAGGRIDMSPAGLVAGGQKISFCLMDSARAPGPPRAPYEEVGLYRGCVGALQGISPGWADTYPHLLAGQQIVIDAVPDGEYAIVVSVNPEGRLLEADASEGDNTSWQAIRLSGGGTHVSPIAVTTPPAA